MKKKKKLIKERYSKFIDVMVDNLNCHNLSLLEETSEKVSVLELEKRKRFPALTVKVFQAWSGVHICLIRHSISNIEYL